MPNLKIAGFQFNPTVGSLQANTNRLIEAILQAKLDGCHLFIAPELAICGYPPEDLLLRLDFCRQAYACLEQLQAIHGITLLIGCPYLENGKCFNSVFVLRDGKLLGRYAKQILPNYEVFDEYRYFTAGSQALVFKCNEALVGVVICEDMWQQEPIMAAKNQGAQLICVINASPFSQDKHISRLNVAKQRVYETGLPLIYINLVGGQDELVFDGASFALNKSAQLIMQFPAFKEVLNYIQLPDQKMPEINQICAYPKVLESIYLALVQAIKDYVAKNGFRGVILGLSGGIDSALTLALAVDALGKEQVMAVMMPSLYTAFISLIDARDMVKRLQVKYQEITINSIFEAFKHQLAPLFSGLSEDITEENLQARIRGTLLMALANKFGYLVLTTGNKSELATGYATLYGDMAGGFAVLKDVLKTLVYSLSKWRNSQQEIIPLRIITRAPSAELREGQTDQDSLPDYAILDAIIKLLVEEKLSSREIVQQGFALDVVTKVANLVKRNEYKRRQGAIGPKISQVSFTKDWRYPITNGFKW